MKIYRVWKVNIGCNMRDIELAFFTSKDKALKYIENMGYINCVRTKKDYRDSDCKAYLSPLNGTEGMTKTYAKSYWNKYNSKNCIYEVFKNGSYYIETITIEKK